MILFVPAYDDATSANLEVARHLSDSFPHALLADEATRESLLDALGDRRALFAMTHGQPDHLRGQNGSIALSDAHEDMALLGNRAVFAFACHTANRLGAAAARAGATWWGYTGPIQCPDTGSGAIPVALFARIFEFIRDIFPGAGDHAEREAALEQIANLCEQAQEDVDERAIRNPDLDVFSAYLCLLHLWDRLRIWAPNEEGPLQHPRAHPPPLFL